MGELHIACCKAGDLTALNALLIGETDPTEREIFYSSTIYMTQSKHPEVAIDFGLRYVEEFYRSPQPFGPGIVPDWRILKQLVLLLDPLEVEDIETFKRRQELAIWVCKFALAFGVSDGTKSIGFANRLQYFENLKPDQT